MPLKQWKKLNEEVLFTNQWWQYRKDIFLLPQGIQGEYHYVFTRGAAMVIPVLPDGKVVMVNQYRYLNDRESLEFPCGGVKENYTYEETATEELAQEAGYKANHLHYIGSFNPYNGVTNEICKIFIATGLEPATSLPDITEEFEKTTLFPDEVDNFIKNSHIWDGMTIAAWCIVKNCIIGKK